VRETAVAREALVTRGQTRFLLLLFSECMNSFWQILIKLKDAALRLEPCL